MKSSLKSKWELRLKFRAEGDKLWAEGDKLWAKGNKLRAKGNKLWIEGDKLWAEAIISIHGNVPVEWKYRDNDYDCIVEGVTYKYRKAKVALDDALKDLKKVK